MTFVFFNCQKEDDTPIQQQIKELNKNLEILTLSGKDINKNARLMEGIDDVAKMSLTNKQVDNETYGFTINTNFAKVIDDGTTRTYTFGVYRDEDNGLLENLFMVEKDDGSFDVSLVQYDLTPQEIEALNNREIIDMEGKIAFVALDDISGDVLGKYYYNGNCYENYWVYQSGNSCASGDHEYTDGNDCLYWRQGNVNQMATSGGYVLTPTIVTCSNGGGGDNTNNPNGNPNGNPNDSNGSGPSDTGGSTSPITCTRNCIDEECNDTLDGILALLSLNEEQACWLNNFAQSDVKQEIIDYLEANGSLEFAEIAIEDLRDNDCGLLPTLNNIQDFQAPYTGDIGDEEDPSSQINHDVIKSQYELLLSTEDKIDAVNYLISTYSMNTFGPHSVDGLYTINFIDGDLPETHTENTFSNGGVLLSSEIKNENPLLTYNDFGYITKAIKHELFHVFQAKYYQFGGTTKAEREFEAYWYSIYRFRRLQQGNRNSLYRWAKEAIKNYRLMTEAQKAIVADKYTTFENHFPEICKED